MPTTVTETETSATTVYSLTKVTVGSASVHVHWKVSGPSVTTYYIRRSRAPLGAFSNLQSVSSSILSATIPFTAVNDKQIPHWLYVIGKLGSNYTLPSNIVTVLPDKGGTENILQYIQNQCKSVLSNDSRLSAVDKWTVTLPEDGMFKSQITGWVVFAGANEDWVQMGGKQIDVTLNVGFHIKTPVRKDATHSLTKTEIKTLLENARRVLADYSTLSDYCFDMDISESVELPDFTSGTTGLMTVIFRKRYTCTNLG